MDNEIELINDGEGLAVIGDPVAVERFLDAAGLPSRDLGLRRLKRGVETAAALTEHLAEAAATSGRWVKLTDESAQKLKNGTLMKGSEPGVSRAVLTENGRIKSNLEIVTGRGRHLTNPALLAGAAGLMAQLSMQQTMAEITDYLARIDAKVDEVLRAQKDAVLAEMVGVDTVVDEAMTVRDHVGRVSEVTWSKVQATAFTIARTQAYALAQMDALADRLEAAKSFGDMADRAAEVTAVTQDWLAVLAHCFRLQDALAVLELDRVLDASPDELDHHRTGLQMARGNRLDRIARTTHTLLVRLDRAASEANTKVLLHPTKSPDVVRASARATASLVEFHHRLGISHEGKTRDARRWRDAAVEARDRSFQWGLDAGGQGADTAVRVAGKAVNRGRVAGGMLSGARGRQILLRRGKDDPPVREG